MEINRGIILILASIGATSHASSFLKSYSAAYFVYQFHEQKMRQCLALSTSIDEPPKNLRKVLTNFKRKAKGKAARVFQLIPVVECKDSN